MLRAMRTRISTYFLADSQMAQWMNFSSRSSSCHVRHGYQTNPMSTLNTCNRTSSEFSGPSVSTFRRLRMIVDTGRCRKKVLMKEMIGTHGTRQGLWPITAPE